jgi:hypothetical protein
MDAKRHGWSRRRGEKRRGCRDTECKFLHFCSPVFQFSFAAQVKKRASEERCSARRYDRRKVPLTNL